MTTLDDRPGHSGANAPGDGQVVRRAPRAPAETLRRRTRRRRLLELAAAAGIPIALLLAWQIAAAANWLDARVYPAPTTWVSAAFDLTAEGRLQQDLQASVVRLMIGFAMGSTSGLAVGFLMGTSRWARAALEPLMSALYVVPKLALLPIFITMFGLGGAPIIVMVTVSVFFYVWIGTMESVSGVAGGFRDAARSLGVSRPQMFFHVLLPASLPSVFVSLRIAVAVSVLSAVAAEFIVGNDGLGHLIFSSRSLFINSWVYAGIACVSIVGVVLGAVITWTGRRLTPWAGDQQRQPHP